MSDSAVEAAETYYYGDMDGNGILNVFDLTLMKKAYINGTQLSGIQQEIVDLDKSGVFDAADIRLLQDYLLARIDSFPSGGVYEKSEEPEAYNGLKTLTGNRMMEKLDRGVVAVSTGKSVFVSWRLLASDESDIGFNVYRTTDGKTVQLNSEPLYGGTNFTDTTADLSKNNTYFVKTVYNGVETDADGDYTLTGNSTAQAITIPIKEGGSIHFVWVGDFNGDGKYDYLLDRTWDDTQKLEAYLNDGTYLWTIDLGYNSENKDNIEPGASTIDVGMWDGATVYDIDCDGTAEVMLRVADGVVFGDGTVFSDKSHEYAQSIAVINGMTGTLEASAPIPDDKIEAGPKACMMEIGYLDGKTPSLICWIKNRNNDKSFNSYNVAYGYGGGNDFKMQWKAGAYGAEAHNIRVADVDYDGKDEVLHMGYALNGDGSLRYVVDNVVHGDRWYVGSFANANNGNAMMGYGIQQNQEHGLLEYFYNASTGELIWEHYAEEGTADVARANVGDVDPNYEGYECWSFQGLYSMDNEKISDDSLYPVIRLWWDGDFLSESWNDGKIEKWNYVNQSVDRVLTAWKVTDCTGSDRGAPMFYGDILGDWREEVILTNYDYSALVILTTTTPTDERLYCLAQNPTYRNCMTGKGYYQSHLLDYYLGTGMEQPETPDICYIGDVDLEDGAVYMLKNANSGLYLEVADGRAENGANIQQWGADQPSAHNTWKLVDAGGGYYNLVSQLGDGKSFALDVTAYGEKNGTNIELYEYTNNKAQKFKITRSGSGYVLKTRVTNDASCVEIVNAETGAGANVQQWDINGHACQTWIFEKIS